MKNTTHRVMILRNVNSSLIEQAILILKDGAENNETGVMAEAEKIVEKYMEGIPTYNRGKRGFNTWLMPIILSAVICLCALIKYIV